MLVNVLFWLVELSSLIVTQGQVIDPSLNLSSKFDTCIGLNRMNPVLLAKETARVSSMFSRCGAKLYIKHAPNWKMFHYLLQMFCFSTVICFNYYAETPNRLPLSLVQNATAIRALNARLMKAILCDSSLRKSKCILHGITKVCMDRIQMRDFIVDIVACYTYATGNTMPDYAEQMFYAHKYIVQHVL